LHIDGGSLFTGIFLARQPCHRHVIKVGVTQVLGPVRIGKSRNFRQQVQVVCASRAHLGDRKLFQDIQHLDDMHTTRTWRWHRDYLVATIRSAHRLTNDWLVGQERCFVHQATATLHFRAYERGRFAFVEPVRSLVSDALQRIGEIFLYE